VTAGGSGHRVTLRRAREDDGAVLREWRNDADAVRFSSTARPVSPEAHARWLAARLADSGTRLWIAEEARVPVGQVRVDLADGTGVVSIVVAAVARGRGIGQAMLRAAIDEIAHEDAAIQLRALIHPDNTASLRAFDRAGFRRVSSDEHGFVVLKRAASG
jgi:UDP-2,4-diacetamido-2,4,6-trideoxy-beta-L-altropyranose hydrolase